MKNMTNPGISVLEKSVDDKCRYTLVIMAAKRARMIADGAKTLTEESEGKSVSVAVNEIAEGRIKYKRKTKSDNAVNFQNLSSGISEDDLNIIE